MKVTYDLTATIDRLNDLIDAGDFDAYDRVFDEYDAKLDEIGASIWHTAKLDGCVRIDHHGLTYYLHRSSRHDGMQLTAWDERGPMSHCDLHDADDLATDIAYERGPIVVTTAA